MLSECTQPSFSNHHATAWCLFADSVGLASKFEGDRATYQAVTKPLADALQSDSEYGGSAAWADTSFDKADSPIIRSSWANGMLSEVCSLSLQGAARACSEGHCLSLVVAIPSRKCCVVGTASLLHSQDQHASRDKLMQLSLHRVANSGKGSASGSGGVTPSTGLNSYCETGWPPVAPQAVQ